MKSFVLFAALVLSLVACAPESGVVTGKRFQPERSWTTTERECKQRIAGTCKAWGTDTDDHHEPARYLLVLRSGDESGEREVPAEAWPLCEVGETYPACSEQQTATQ